MISEDAVVNLFALAHPGRLNVFRTIVKAGPDGMAAGKIAAANTIPANTASTHLQHPDRRRAADRLSGRPFDHLPRQLHPLCRADELSSG
ncbi:MAG: helix-turn-helix domain-containing protein [Asticcacaulis sp.]|nr:helix-turn-helix domain-containing protein [Asticcacaulis sp.]